MKIRQRIFKTICRIGLKVFFRKIVVEGEENLRGNHGCLIVPNHVNGLVDALLVIAVSPRPVTIIAKAALKKNPGLRFVLWLACAEVVHRTSDDASLEAKKENARVLDGLSEKLIQGEVVCLFPEGVSHSDPGLREFKSGAARVGVAARVKSSNVEMIPTMLLYADKSKWRSDILVRFLPSMLRAKTSWNAGDAKELTVNLQQRLDELLPTFENNEERDLAVWLAAGTASQVHSNVTVGTDRADIQKFFELFSRASKVLKNLRTNGSNQTYSQVLLRVSGLKKKFLANSMQFEELFAPRSLAESLVFAFREVEIVLLGIIESVPALLLNAVPLCMISFVMKKSKDEDHVATNAIFIGVPLFLLWYSVVLLCLVVFMGVWKTLILLPVFAFSTYLLPLFYDRMVRVNKRTSSFFRYTLNRQGTEELRSDVEELQKYLTDVEKA